jgi:hypothetical protein
MTKILGIAGKKQSGKNTTANILHGLILKEKGMILDFNIGPVGELMVKTTNTQGAEGWGVFDITRKDGDFIDYAENNMWPYVKLYSFADTLKWICMELFDIPKEQLFGSDTEKNTAVPHLLWENIPFHIDDINDITNETIDNISHKNQTPMSAREFMQFFGTNIMRRIYDNIWTNNTIKRIKAENTELAIISDVRFPNEVEAITNEGGVVIKLTRNPFKDKHASETSLDNNSFDQSNFTHVIKNGGKSSLETLLNKVQTLYKQELSTV